MGGRGCLNRWVRVVGRFSHLMFINGINGVKARAQKYGKINVFGRKRTVVEDEKGGR